MSIESGDDPAHRIAGSTDGPGPFESITDRSRHPMVIATVSSIDGEAAGCLVGFHTRCSVEPARYLVCLSTRNRTFEVASEVDTMVVHHVDAGDVDLARWFGEETGDEVDKFAGVAWSRGPAAPRCSSMSTAGGREGSWRRSRWVITPGSCSIRSPAVAGVDRAPFTAEAAADFDAGHEAG